MMLSQLDERWKNIPLGTSGSATIGSHGCLITSAVPMWWGHRQYDDPATLNYYLCNEGGYIGGNLAVFSKLAPPGYSVEVVDCKLVPAPVRKISQCLDDGGFPLVQVDFRPGGSVQQHWVRILELDEDAKIHDPWLSTGESYWLCRRYGHWSWPSGLAGVSRAIFRMALYTPASSNAGVRAYFESSLGENQRYLCPRNPTVFEKVRGYIRKVATRS